MKIPIPLAHLNDNKFSYIIYSWMVLPENSKLNKEEQYRYLKEEDLNKSKISKESIVSLSTVKRKLPYILSCKDIVEIEKGIIKLHKTNKFILIDENILRLLINEVNENVLKFYFALKYYEGKFGRENLFVSLYRIAGDIGVNMTNRKRLKEYYQVLSEKGFISVDKKRLKADKEQNLYTIFTYREILSRRSIEIENETDNNFIGSKTVVIKKKYEPVNNPHYKYSNQKKTRELEPIDMESLLSYHN